SPLLQEHLRRRLLHPLAIVLAGVLKWDLAADLPRRRLGKLNPRSDLAPGLAAGATASLTASTLGLAVRRSAGGDCKRRRRADRHEDLDWPLHDKLPFRVKRVIL